MSSEPPSAHPLGYGSHPCLVSPCAQHRAQKPCALHHLVLKGRNHHHLKKKNKKKRRLRLSPGTRTDLVNGRGGIQTQARLLKMRSTPSLANTIPSEAQRVSRSSLCHASSFTFLVSISRERRLLCGGQTRGNSSQFVRLISGATQLYLLSSC